MTLADLKIAAEKVLARMTGSAADRRAKEHADVASAVQDHAHLVDGWKNRHEAERREAAAMGLYAALNDIEDEGGGK